MQRKLKILYISSEAAPFVTSGSLADVAGSLPKFLKDMGHDIRLFIPKYGTIIDRKYTIREVIRLKQIKVPLHNKTVIADVKSAFLPNTKVQVYFVENKDYFDRTELYVDPKTNKEWEDNAERFIFFSRSIFAILKKLHWQPDIIHCNDWQTALIPFFLKNIYHKDTFFNKSRTILSIHDMSSQGIYEKNIVTFIADPKAIFYPKSAIENQGKVNFLKAGIVYADLINTTSKSNAKEIRTSDESSFGLKEVFRKRAKNLYGVVNGVDYSIWDPEVDTLIPHTYSRKDFSGKVKNKYHLAESLGLKVYENKPVIGIISQVIDQNSFDMLMDIVKKLLKIDAQYIITGTGNEKFDNLFQSFVKRFPEKIAFRLKLDDQLTHLMIAGCDMFLIPCRFEPYMSFHLYCLKYGTLPIVHATGVFVDTIKDYNPETKLGYGFVFKEYSPASLLYTINYAVKVYHDKDIWKKLIDRAMKLNFSWEAVAENYIKLYYKLVN